MILPAATSQDAPPIRPQDHPTSTGVYIMKDAAGVVLYVGKARNLRSRLRSYLRREEESRPQIRFLLERVATVETIVTDTEQEALILENTLIKEHRPRYNIHLRDDKTYVSLRIDLRDDFPWFQIVRKVAADGARYFGPFASSLSLRETLKHIYRIFPLRHYPRSRCFSRKRPCLFHQIGQCSAPCHGKITPQAYRELVDGAVALLEGRGDEILRQLRRAMREAAAEMRFEEAAALRNRIAAIEQTVEKQKVTVHGGGDSDVFGLARDGEAVEIVVLPIRQGQLRDRRHYRIVSDLPSRDLLAAAVQQFYAEAAVVPAEVWTPEEIDGSRLLSSWLSQRHGGRVALLVPRRGEKRRLVEMACRNAEEILGQRGEVAPAVAADEALEEIARAFGLNRLPRRIECFDISHHQGDCTVGSMAVCLDGKIARRDFRRYEIRTLQAGESNDYAALAEVLARRLERGATEGGLPHLIVIDGGRGQLTVLVDQLQRAGLAGVVEAAAIAKARSTPARTGRGRPASEERFFRPGGGEAITFPENSAPLHLLAQLRDEAHRYAVTYHRSLQRKKQLSSRLRGVPGVGESRRLLLLKHFGSIKAIAAASAEELSRVPGIGARLAEEIVTSLAGGRVVRAD